MQIDRLYPTQGTPQYGIETTALFMSIPELVDDMGDQYLMGYVNSDEISMVAPVEIINGGDTVTMSKVPGNFGWGYAMWAYTGSYGPGALYYNDNGTLTRKWGINYDFSFINSIEMARVNTSPTLIPYISVAAIKSEFIDGYKMTSFELVGAGGNVSGTTLDNYVENTYTIDGWKNIIDNDLPIFSGTVTLNQTQITVPLTLRPSDFEHENGMKFALIPTDQGYTLHCRILGLKLGDTSYYYDQTHTLRYNIIPFFQFPDTTENPAIVAPGTLLLSQVDLSYENGGISITQGRTGGSDYYNELFLQGDSNENSRIFGGFNLGTLSVNDIDFTRIFSTSSTGWWAFVGNYVLQLVSKSSGRGTFRVHALYTPRDIYNYVRLWHKRTDTPSETYSTADTVTVFDPTETPTFETVSGTLSQIVSRLRPWQMPNVDITADDFTPEDIPPEPGPGPEPGGEPDEGDRGVPIPKFGNTPGQTEFVHYAAMTPFAINELATQLWDKPDSFWQKIVASTSENPMDYFISLRYYPVQFNKGDGKTDMHIGRGGELHIANNFYPLFPVEDFDCGSITIKRQYYNFLDYAPYTRIQIFLPFAGTFELNPTIVMGRVISLWLSVDVSDGSAVWEVYNETDNQPVLIKQCRMGAEIPLSGLDASQMASNVINASLQTAQHTLSAAKTDLSSRVGVAGQALSGNMEGALSGAVGSVFNGPQAVLTGLGDAYNLAQASKEIPQYTGGSSGAAACGMNHTPYIVYRRPLCTNPSNFAHAVGYLSNKTAAISSLSGFTTCRNVDISGISQATDKEKAQIKQILESGFYA